MHNYRIILYATFLITLGIAASSYFHYQFNPIEFNQFVIASIQMRYGVASPEVIFDTIISIILSGSHQLSGNPIRTVPSFGEEELMFAYVFSHTSPYAVVYPTEGFYYYNFIHPEKGPVSGNFRLADLDLGKMSVAYFTKENKETVIFEMNANNGLKVSKINDYEYKITYDDRTVFFKIAKTGNIPPARLKLLPEEEFVGQIHDESDTKFFLIYNYRTHAFYNVLNDEMGASEELHALNNSIMIGKRTRFAYYFDEKHSRKIHIGVYYPNIEQNNFFDGPGDQVPFRAELKRKLLVTYPNTQLGDGIDEHGVYLGKTYWSRIAISPFMRYAHHADLFERVGKCVPNEESSTFWTCLTREWWNTEAWRRGIYSKIINEGKKPIIPSWESFTIEDINSNK